ncbi:hypothetical protein GDO81_001605 [Engystomops pustulosus]|uniref:Family with sequence similarity 189 member A2 n=1 Tax=Engystomops pustulosus TaxID=76066 RepID=A0AAV7DEB9_ENGPU|nr:hypothetical protein GDO81_001605 [Engystomops pustulosus]
MSLPVLLPGSCCPMAGLSSSMGNAAPVSSAGGERARRGRGVLHPPRCAASLSLCPPPAPPHLSSRRRAGAALILPGRPLLSLGLLQLILGCCTVALSFGALSLSKSPQIRSSCPFWAGSSVILSGIIGLTTWKKPMVLLVNLFVMLSVICVLLNLAGFILGCQGAQFVSSVPSCHLVDMTEGKICVCCEEPQASKCLEKENVLKLVMIHSCNAVHLLLKKVFFALCALNALTTTVCLVAAALRYLQLLTTRRPCTDESQVSVEEAEEPDREPDYDDFVPPAPPPSYFSTFCSNTPRMSQRMVGNEMIPLPHIYGSRFKGVEVFCPVEPPPPYESVVNQSHSLEETMVIVHFTFNLLMFCYVFFFSNHCQCIVWAHYQSLWSAMLSTNVSPVLKLLYSLCFEKFELWTNSSKFYVLARILPVCFKSLQERFKLQQSCALGGP